MVRHLVYRGNRRTERDAEGGVKGEYCIHSRGREERDGICACWEDCIGWYQPGLCDCNSCLLGGGIRLGGFVGFCGWMPFQEDMDGIAKCIEEQKETATSPLLEEIWNPPPLSTENPEWRTERNLIAQLKQAHRTPVFLSHSKDDNVVPIGNGVRLSQCLADICESIEWRTYEDGGHWVKEPQGVDDMVNFIKSKVLS